MLFQSCIVSVVKSFRKTTFVSLTEMCVLQDINPGFDLLLSFILAEY